MVGFDVEMSGTLREYALQPWRVAQGTAWLTCFATAQKVEQQIVFGGGLGVDVPALRAFLERAVAEKLYVVGWNLTFDIQWLIAYGLRDLVFQVKWLDGMLLWKHLTVEPEYELAKHKKKSYGLKACVAEVLPQFAGYEEDIDFHSTDPTELAKLNTYCRRDTVFALRLTKHWYQQLAANPTQLRAALIEAECLPLVAQANLEGMVVDVLAARELQQYLLDIAARTLAALEPFGVTETVVRSPTKLATLLFDEWGLPVLKENTGKKTKKVTRSTDKEVLHELSFMDDRVAGLRLYRGALNNRTKFAKAPLDSVAYNGDERSHPAAIVFGTYCVPGDVEVLTPTGWQALQTWDGGDIMQVHPDLTMAFLPATRFVGPTTDQWVHVKQQGLDCKFTPGHTVPYLAQKTYAWRTTQAQQLLTGEARNIPVAGVAALQGQYTAAQMRLFAAVQADGYSTERYLKFTFVKERKVTRIQELLQACGVQFRVYRCDAYPERTEIVVAKSFRPAWLNHEKKHLGAWLLDTTQDGLTAFVDEVVHWDGSVHPDGGVKYGSSKRDNVEWVVTAAALTGCKATIHRPASGGMWSCHISSRTVRPCRTVSPRYTSEVQEAATTYCATTVTGFWLARSQGKIFITGNTGRLTYSSKQGKNKDERQTGFALHQEKRGKEFRSIIVPPPGYTLMEFDASGQEFRWMAIAAQDPTMLELCEPGEDPHSYMGARIARVDYRALIADVHAGVPLAKEQRQSGKVGNLSLQFRISAKRFRVTARVQYNMNMELPEAMRIRATYLQTYRRVPRYWDEQIALTRRRGWVETFAGRRVQVVGNWSGDRGWSMESTSINYRIQGTGADQKYLALAVLRPYLVKIGARFAWDLHDGIYLYVPHAQVERAKHEIPQKLLTLPYRQAWGFQPPIPLPWDCKVGHSWGTLREE